MSLDPQSVEQRLLDAFQRADRVEPSDDLWTRVVHSIEEDRSHRRRVVATIAIVLTVVAGLVVVAVPFVREDPLGRSIDPLALEMIETVALGTLIATLGPAIRRFGRNFARDLWTGSDLMASALLRLLDVAYFLVFIGYVLITSQLDQVVSDRAPFMREHLAEQLSTASLRIGGLLLVMGILHALTMFALPIVALVDNSTRCRRALPRWLVVAGAILLVTQIVPAIPLLVALLIGAAG